MKRLTPRTVAFLVIDAVLVTLCALHVPALMNRAQAPFTVHEVDGRVLIDRISDTSAAAGVVTGDELLLWQHHRVNAASTIEYLAELSYVGRQIPLTLKRDMRESEVMVRLVPSYSLLYVVIVCFVGIITLCLGIFVLVSQPGNPAAVTLHWAMVSMAVTVVVAYEGTTPANPVPLVSRLLFFLSYAGTASTFLLFTILFPSNKPGTFRLKALLVFLPAAVLVALMTYYHSRAVADPSADAIARYAFWFLLFHLLLLLYVAGGVFTFIHSYVTAVTSEERRKLQWILLGLCLGPLPFLSLIVLPNVLGFPPIVPEDYALPPLVIIPVAFAVSIIRYQVLDIEVIVRRTTAYAIVIGGVLFSYIVLVSVVASLVGRLTASIASTILVALLFEPLRIRVQHMVDKRFFRVRYDFRQAEQHFIASIKRSLTVPEVGETLVRETAALIPVERIGLFSVVQPGNQLHLLAHRGFDPLQSHAPRLDIQKLKMGLQLPVARDDTMEPGITYESADPVVFQRWKMALVLALLSPDSGPLGVLVLGSKKSGRRFTIEDVDLLRNVCTQAGLTIERITLQQKLFMEHAESERLRELSQLKSDFVNDVFHSAVQPLQGIKLQVDLLRLPDRQLGREETKSVSVIERESERLARMVNNALESAKIEKGVKLYEFREIDLAGTSRTAVEIMSYELHKQGFRFSFSCRTGRQGTRARSRAPLPIMADQDAVIDAITNLISNSIKYSGEEKQVNVSVFRRDGFAVCRIQDKGLGIAPEALPHLFEKFYRDPRHSRHVRGVGLGLPYVKHIMETHNGSVDVRSAPGKGSTFTLSFQLKNSTHGRKTKSSGR